MREKYLLTIVLILFIQVMVSCTGQASKAVDIENPSAEISALWSQFIESWEAEDAAACASLYHTEGLNIPNEYRVNSGPAEIEEFYAALFANNQSGIYRHRMESLHFFGDSAVEYATFQVDWIANGGEMWSYNARALVHWKKDGNSIWKIKTMLFNTPPSADTLP